VYLRGVLCPDKLGPEDWSSILKEHFNDLLEILAEFVECFSLAVCSRKSGYVTDIKPRGRGLVCGNQQ